MVNTQSAKIPFAVASRTLAVLEAYGSSKLIKSAKTTLKRDVWLKNLGSRVRGIHVYDSLDCLQTDSNLRIGDFVGLSYVEVTKLEVFAVGLKTDSGRVRQILNLPPNNPRKTLEVTIQDDTGETSLLFPYYLNAPVEDFGVSERTMLDNPLLGAQIGDQVTVYSGILAESNKIAIVQPWHVRNDDHHKRSRAIISSDLAKAV